MNAMNKQKVCLMSLLIYVNRAMTKDDLSSSFFPQFMMYLNSGSHACKCSDCHLSYSQQSDTFTLVSDSSVSSDLTHYSDSNFTFTDESNL